MFTDMGVTFEPSALRGPFAEWLREMMPRGVYRAWVVEEAMGKVIAGGGISILTWPPGPLFPGDKLAFVYNVYVDRAHRRRGLARLVMDAIHQYCREAGIASLALNASQAGQPLYESLGYRATGAPMMVLALQGHLV